MATRWRLTWTAQAAGYAALGLGLIFLGPLLDSPYWVVLGGALLLWMILDAGVAAADSPQPRLQVTPSRVPEESETSVTVEARAGRGGQQFRVHLDRGLALPQNESNVWTPEKGDTRHAFKLRAAVRGPQRVGPVEVRSWSPSRIWAMDDQLLHIEEVEVIPRILEGNVGLRSRVLKPMQGRFQINRPGQGFDFFTLRQYASGDTIRDVNWKASAKRDDGLIVNQRQRETQSEILLLLDARVVSGVGPAGSTPLDRSCRLILALYSEASSNRDITRFLAYGQDFQEVPSRGPDRLRQLENVLARLPAKGTNLLMEAWERARRDMRSRGPIIILTSAEGDPTLPAAIADMVGRGHPVTLVSPRPLGSTYDGPDSAERRRQRDAWLQQVRDRGAAVLDWQDEKPPWVPAPELGVLV